ncbi:unnamed protein product [Aphanomyces euteiches]
MPTDIVLCNSSSQDTFDFAPSQPRLFFTNLNEQSSSLPSSPQKKKTRRQNTHDEYKQDDGSDDENKAADSDDDESKRDEEDDEVLYKGTKAIRHGTVTKVRSNDEYDVAYSDCEVEKHVPHKHLAKSTKATEEEWDEGMQVDARGKDSPTYYRGEILLVRTNGTFDVKFKNGAEEQKLPRKWIRKHQSKDKKTTKEHDKNRDDDNLYKEDDIVEAKVTGSDKYFRGKIVKCRTNGTFDILFDDGDKEKGVVKDSIRSIQVVYRYMRSSQMTISFS